ncbi:Vps5-domain-containing protein [Hortaea werneckii]|nr:Vps5-domain-containing protein [Hortaea werneckii]KAI6994740.1 Vps5-domain-containing protein [Hortaea werneckii]
MADRVAAPENPWSAAMDEDGSPWDDVPSRSQSNHNLAQAGEEAQTDNDAPPSQPPEPASPPPPVTSRPTASKTRGPRRHNVNLAQSTTLESLDDDSMGPLGPLGAEPSLPEPEPEPAAPAPPVKELPNRTRAPSRPSTGGGASSIRSGDHSEDGASLNGSARSMHGQRPPRSQPVEQAAKPTFSITVGDPHTVGNAASSHTVYSVITRTTSKAYVNPNFTVTRRYRDFLWLYERLHENNPGTIVAPPPEKQAVGRFEQNFIESRRMALERMLNKIAAHPVLQHDADLKTFLESETFNVDIKHRDRSRDPLLGLDSKPSGGAGGFMSSLGLGGGGSGAGSSGKFIEHDDWFHDRRIYLDALENQLKALQKSTDTVVAQRKSLAETCGDFSTSLHHLASAELSPALSGPLDSLGDIQLRINELYSRQAMQDILTLGIVIDEYIRLIGSVKKAFEQRQKAYHSWHSAEAKLQEIKKQQEKLLRAGRTQQDRLQQMQAEVGEGERRVNAARVLFEDLGRLMRGELERFEREKVEDFKSGVETFLESAIEAQKELIELWETYLYHLDTDEDGPPPPVGATAGVQAPNNDEGGKSDAQMRREALESEGALEGGADATQAQASARLSGTTARESEEEARVSRPHDGGDSPHDDDDVASERRRIAEA